MIYKNTHISMNNSFILFFSIFSSLIVFFAVMHPMTLISGDDWIGISSYRDIYPKWHGFNPTKVLPEVLFPASGVLSSIFSNIFRVNYLQSISLITAILVSIAATAFLYQLYKLLTDKYSTNQFNSSLIIIIVLMTLLFMFKTLPFNKSTYLLWEINITCYYHYVIPVLLNSSVVLHLINHKQAKSNHCENKGIYFGVLSIAIYFSIFSNVFASIILAVHCGTQLLFSLLNAKFNYKKTDKSNILYVCVILLWIVSLVFEMNGGRASSIGKQNLEFLKSLDVLKGLLHQTDVFYAIMILISIATGVYLSFHKLNTTQAMDMVKNIISALIVSIGLLLISAKASPSYAERPVAMFGLFFFLILTFSIAMAFILTTVKTSVLIMPVIFTILIAKAFAYNTSLMNPHNLNLDYATAEKISNAIIGQVIEADLKGNATVTVRVPKGDDNDNWPWPIYMGESISKTLRLNGIIKNNIVVSVVPDTKLNEAFGIPAAK